MSPGSDGEHPNRGSDAVLLPRWVAKVALQALIPQRELARLRARADQRWAAEALRLETAVRELQKAISG